MESYRSEYLQNRLGRKERAVDLGASPNLLPAAAHSAGYLLQDVDANSFFEYFGIGTDLYAVTSTDTVIDASDIKFNDDHIRFSGSPLTIDTYRINDSLLPYAIIFDRNKRVKMNGLTALHFGIPGPTYQATAANNGAGNLNATYDWRYQYRVESTGSVSPLSPVMRVSLVSANNSVDVTVRQPNDTQITHIDLYRRGGTLTDGWYFVKSALSTAFAGTQVIVDNLADADLGDVVATNQIEFSNVLHPPTTTRKTVNIGVAYTNYTVEASDSDDTTHVVLSSLDTLANGDWLVIGADLQFRKIAIGLDSTLGVVNPANHNTNTSVLTVEYWNGTAWTAVSRMTDGTASGGKTFFVNGLITYDFPADWVVNVVDGITAYHVRLTVSAALSASVLLDGIRVSAMEFDADTFAIHADRLWANDLTNPDKLWYSQRFRIEEFRDTNFIIIGKGGDRTRRPIALDDRLFALTDDTAYFINGTDETSFQAIATGAEQGLYARFAVTKGNGRIFYRSYDGIYALAGSSGTQKLSDPQIDVLFRGIPGGTDATQLAILNTFNTLDYERMTYFNGKLYWSYKRSDSVRQEFVYDVLVGRWYMSDFKPTAYLPIDYQGNLFFADENKYLYLRDRGNSDIDTVTHPITMKFRTGFADFGAPEQDKNFVEMVLDADTVGQSLVVMFLFDNGDFTTTHTVSGASRQRFFLPINGGKGVFAKNVAMSVSASNANVRMRLYKLTLNFWTEPRELNKTSWDWNDYGDPERKFFKQLFLNLDTQGTAANVSVFLDGSTTAVASFANVVTSGREWVTLSLPIDSEGKMAKVLVESIQSQYQVKAYTHYFHFINNNIEVGKDQTDWSDEGYLGDKRYNQLALEVDTFGRVITVNIEIDHVIVDTFQTSCTGKMVIPRSLPGNSVGKVGRLTFNRS